MFSIFLFLRKIMSEYSLLRFAVVGILCTIVDVTVYWLMLFIVPYSIAMIVGYFVSLILNFVFTTLWTFRASMGVMNFISVLAIHLFNCFVLRANILDIFVKACEYEERLAYILTILITVPLNYILLRGYFTLRDK